MKVAQSCLTLCNPMDYKVRGILQVRMLKWIAFPFSRESSWPRNWTGVSHIAYRSFFFFFYQWAIREAHLVTKSRPTVSDPMDWSSLPGFLSMGFPRQEYWSESLFSSPGDLPDSGIEPMSPTLADRFFTTEPPGKPCRSHEVFCMFARKTELLS